MHTVRAGCMGYPGVLVSPLYILLQFESWSMLRCPVYSLRFEDSSSSVLENDNSIVVHTSSVRCSLAEYEIWICGLQVPVLKVLLYCYLRTSTLHVSVLRSLTSTRTTDY